MTREEAIERWIPIVEAVFYAEDKIKNQWESVLKSVKSMTKERREQTAHEYLRAVAVEITNKTSDEELAKLD